MTSEALPCSLTDIFMDAPPQDSCRTDKYKVPFDKMIFDYRLAYQMLQLTILENDLIDAPEIGRQFQELERHFEKLISAFVKTE